MPLTNIRPTRVQTLSNLQGDRETITSHVHRYEKEEMIHAGCFHACLVLSFITGLSLSRYLMHMTSDMTSWPFTDRYGDLTMHACPVNLDQNMSDLSGIIKILYPDSPGGQPISLKPEFQRQVKKKHAGASTRADVSKRARQI